MLNICFDLRDRIRLVSGARLISLEKVSTLERHTRFRSKTALRLRMRDYGYRLNRETESSKSPSVSEFIISDLMMSKCK